MRTQPGRGEGDTTHSDRPMDGIGDLSDVVGSVIADMLIRVLVNGNGQDARDRAFDRLRQMGTTPEQIERELSALRQCSQEHAYRRRRLG